MVDRLDEVGAGRVVSIFGAGGCVEGEQAYQDALAVGRALGEADYAVANGGYGGTMEASARGAREGGGAVIGVTCSVWKSRPNRYVDRVVETASLSERIGKLTELGRAGYVVLPGATGTLAELAWVWELAFKGLLARGASGGDRPIVCLGLFWRPLLEFVDTARPGAAQRVSVISAVDQLGEYFPGGAGLSAPPAGG